MWPNRKPKAILHGAEKAALQAGGSSTFQGKVNRSVFVLDDPSNLTEGAKSKA